MGHFNNREVATAFWLLLLALWALRKGEVRRSVGAVLRAIWHFNIIVSICLMLIYLAGTVVLLATVGIWKANLLKDTVWVSVGAIGMMMRFITADNVDSIFQTILRENVRIVVLFEFLTNTYTFPLVVELILVPLLTFIALLDVVAGKHNEYAVVAGLTKRTQMVAGGAIFTAAVSRAIADFRNLRSFDTFRSVALAPVLSVLMCPFVYIMVLYSRYELVFVRLALGREKTQRLKRYARRKIIVYAGFSLNRLQWLLKNRAFDLMHIEKESDVDSLLRQARSADHRT